MWSVAAALDIIYTEAAAGFAESLQHRVELFHTRKLVHHALTSMYGSNVVSGNTIGTCSNHF